MKLHNEFDSFFHWWVKEMPNIWIPVIINFCWGPSSRYLGRTTPPTHSFFFFFHIFSANIHVSFYCLTHKNPWKLAKTLESPIRNLAIFFFFPVVFTSHKKYLKRECSYRNYKGLTIADFLFAPTVEGLAQIRGVVMFHFPPFSSWSRHQGGGKENSTIFGVFIFLVWIFVILQNPASASNSTCGGRYENANSTMLLETI